MSSAYIPIAMPLRDEGVRALEHGMTVHCRFFATYAEQLGRESFDLTLPVSATVADAVRRLRVELEHGERLPPAPMVAVNREHAGGDRRLVHGDEVALLPPLAGG